MIKSFILYLLIILTLHINHIELGTGYYLAISLFCILI